MKSHVFGLALLSVIAIVASAPAHAQNGSLTRSFVSSAGVDSNACTVTAPCASFAQAYTKIAANGIIAALDPGKYGPIAITGPVTINGNGWAAITGPAGNTAITVNASEGNVILNGLELDGAGTANYGINVTAAYNITINNCTVMNFSNENAGYGIYIEPTSDSINFLITNTTVSNNVVGIAFTVPVNTGDGFGTIDHVVAAYNSYGILLSDSSTAGGTAAIAITSSTISANNNGIEVSGRSTGSVIDVTLDRLNINGNTNGVNLSIGGNVLLGRSTITGNTVSGIINATDSPGTFYSYKNNEINLNGNNNQVGGTPLIALTYQ
jgi:hypothetical protein